MVFEAKCYDGAGNEIVLLPGYCFVFGNESIMQVPVDPFQLECPEGMQVEYGTSQQFQFALSSRPESEMQSVSQILADSWLLRLKDSDDCDGSETEGVDEHVHEELTWKLDVVEECESDQPFDPQSLL